MSEYRSTLERELERLSPRRIPFDQLVRRRDRKRRDQRIRAGLLGLSIAIAVGWLCFHLIRSTPPIPADRSSVLRANGEVLSFTGARGMPGDLVAVNPETGEERLLVRDLEWVYSARWSADGRWVAYETAPPGGSLLDPHGDEPRWLWVVGPSQERRLVATAGDGPHGSDLRWSWMWSPTGAELATLNQLRLSTIDPATGETTDLGSILERLGDVNSGPAWSPDGTRFVFGGHGGALYSVDVRTGEPSLLVRLPGDQILWSPDGTHLAVMDYLEPGPARLYVVNADGSNVRVLVDDFGPAGVQFEPAGGVAWSPDGGRLAYYWSEPDQKVQISVAPMDGSAPAEIVSLVASCAGGCGLTWSPDGSRIAFRTAIGVPIPGDGLAVTSAIDADGQGDPVRIDELTYRSWDGGGYRAERRR
jgi:Tol biopolymer transport system component